MNIPFKKIVLCWVGILCWSQDGFSQSPMKSHTIYWIQAEFNPNKQVITATAEIIIPRGRLVKNEVVYIKTKSAGMGQDGKPLLRINRIYHPDVGALAHRQIEGKDLISVDLPREAGNRDVRTLLVDFTIPLDQQPAWIMSNFGYLVFYSNATGDYTNGDLWYPDVMEETELPIQIRDFMVTLTYPEKYTVFTSGIISGQEKLSGGKVRTKFAAEGISGFSVNIAEGFETYTMEHNGYQVTSFYPPKLEKEYKRAVSLTLNAMSWYEQEYGFFPVNQIVIAAGGKNWGGGYPAPNLFWVHRRDLDKEFVRWITSHELGHYYWGYHVLSGSDQKLDWLLLANGIWVDQLYIAEANNRSFEEQWRLMGSGDWFVDYFQALLMNREQRLDLPAAEQSALDFDYNSLVRHGKAATGLYLISQRIGTERFLEIQKQIIKEKKHRVLTVQDFIGYLESAGYENAETFVRGWMRGDASIGYAVYDVESTENSINEYEITILRTGTVAYPITIEVVDSGGHKVRREVTGTERREKITVALSSPLVRVNLDPDGTLPMENSSHPEIQRLYIEALYRARLDKTFIKVAEEYLDRYPSDEELKKKVESRKKLYHTNESAEK